MAGRLADQLPRCPARRSGDRSSVGWRAQVRRLPGSDGALCTAMLVLFARGERLARPGGRRACGVRAGAVVAGVVGEITQGRGGAGSKRGAEKHTGKAVPFDVPLHHSAAPGGWVHGCNPSSRCGAAEREFPATSRPGVAPSTRRRRFRCLAPPVSQVASSTGPGRVSAQSGHNSSLISSARMHPES